LKVKLPSFQIEVSRFKAPKDIADFRIEFVSGNFQASRKIVRLHAYDYAALIVPTSSEVFAQAWHLYQNENTRIVMEIEFHHALAYLNEVRT